jgi:Tol biopolymer transport system component
MFLWSVALGLSCFSSRAAFVYETPAEFITSGDFDGDGRVDALVLDKTTGNVRVGYQNFNGGLDWSAPRATGADSASALAVGRFAETNRDAIAVTAADLNQIRVLNLSSPSNSPAPAIINPAHAGASLLVGLDAPYGVTANRSWLTAGAHDPGITLLDLFAFFADSQASFQDQIVAEGYLSSGNSLAIGTNVTTFVTGMMRGSNDTFAAYSYASQSNVLYRVGLSAGTEYTPGHFQWSRDTNAVSVMIFYVPGQSNLMVQRIIASGGGYSLGAPMTSTFTSAIQRVYFVDEGTNGYGVIQFGDGVMGVRPAGTNDELQISAGLGLGPAGNVITGVVPLGLGKFALLSSASNLLASSYAQVFTQSGGNYIQSSSNALPAVTSVATRGNVWLFQIEPFASSAASLIGSLSAPAWSSSISGMPGTLSVRVESDGGTTTGLNNPATNNFGPPPAGTAYVLPNQYRDDVSFFGYGSARAPEPSVVTISPPPGSYDGPIQISFTRQNATDDVQYRLAPGNAWQLYATPFPLTNDATVEFYGQTTGGARSRTQSASYALGNIAVPAEPLVTLPGSDTNPPAVNPTIPHISASGTVFYGRRGNNTVTNTAPTMFYTANDVVFSFTPPGPPTIFANLPLYTNPEGLVFDTSGNLFVAGGGDVSKITPDGTVSLFATLPGFGGYGMVIDAANNLYVAGAASLEIKKITPGGTVSTYATLASGTTGMVLDGGGNLYTVGGGYTVKKIPAGGGAVTDYATLGGNNLYGLAFDSFGYLYASDITKTTLYKIPPGGGSYVNFGTLTSGVKGLAFDQSGNLYGTQYYEDKICKITPDGTVTTYGSNLGGPRYLTFKSATVNQLGNDLRLPSIWAINLDGSGETFITTGREPRASRDGHWLAFWRENDPLTNQFSLWLRDLPAGQENRWLTRSNRFVGYDWQRDNTNLIFAVDGLFWQIGASTPPVAFPLATDTQQGAPAVNPADGRVALQVIYPGSTGIYLAPSNLTTRQNLSLNILSPRWPAWSPDGTRLAVADDPNISPVLDAGHNLWVVNLGGQTNIYQITALTGTNGFPNGAVWSPGGNKLVTAGRIGGVNGLWVIPVSSDGSACHCQPQLLPTSPGDPIDFAGSVLTTATGASASYANLGLFIRLDPALLVVYWSTNYDGFALESATELPAGLSWSSVTGPYFRAGPYFEYREARTALAARKYFRLHSPGVLVLTPPEPAMALHLEPNAAVLNWPLNYVGYTIEATTNLSPPALWIPLADRTVNTNGMFEYRRVLPGPAQEFYRLRGPQ